MFHVEISAGMHRARVFNLNREDLLAKVVEPWLRDHRIEMGDREWVPRESSLTILEGSQMGNADLAFGQGWSNAERGSKNVTHEVLSQAPAPRVPDAFVIEAEDPDAVLAERVDRDGTRAIGWEEAQRRLDGRDPKVAAVILVVRRDQA